MEIKRTPIRRVSGNFLWTIYANAPRHKQMEFKERLIEAGGTAFSLWQSFNKIQSVAGKEDNFNAEIVGNMVQIFCEDKIKLMYNLTDLEKLKLKNEQIECNSKTVLPMFN